MREERQGETDRPQREQTRLEDEQLKLLQAHYADAVPISLLKKEPTRIAGQVGAIQRKLRQLDVQFSQVNTNLERVLGYLTNLAASYRRSGSRLADR